MAIARISLLLCALAFVGPDAGPTPQATRPPDDGTDPFSQMRIVGAGLLRARDHATHRVPIDVGADCALLLQASTGGLTLEARSPSGKVFSSKRDEPGGHGASAPDPGEEGVMALFGPMEFLELEHPETGTWTLEVHAGDLPDSVTSAAYQLKLIQNTAGRGPQLRVLLPEGPYHRGDSLEVRASLLEDGKPVTGARVQGFVGGDDVAHDPPVRLRLLDDGLAPDARAGDGVYTARVDRLDFTGFGEVEVEAARRDVEGLPDFDRSAEGHLLVSASRSRFTGAIRDVARDADHDGVNEAIVFLVGVNVTDAARLAVRGTVRDAKGKEVWTFGQSQMFEPGEHELELSCDTDGMHDAAPGPLSLDSLRLFEEETYAELDRATPHYRTRPFAAAELMHDAIRIVDGNGKATGVDLDHDGKFDALDVAIGIDIRFPGTYYCTGELEIGDEQLSSGDVRLPFVQGRNVMKFRFPGLCIASPRSAAKYRIGGIYVGYEQFPGDTKPSPRYGYTAWAVNLDGGPPPNQFEPTDLPATGRDDYRCR